MFLPYFLSSQPDGFSHVVVIQERSNMSRFLGRITIMKNSIPLMLTRALTLLLITVFFVSPVWATCGGGGGGGVGGMSGGSGGGATPAP